MTLSFEMTKSVSDACKLIPIDQWSSLTKYCPRLFHSLTIIKPNLYFLRKIKVLFDKAYSKWVTGFQGWPLNSTRNLQTLVTLQADKYRMQSLFLLIPFISKNKLQKKAWKKPVIHGFMIIFSFLSCFGVLKIPKRLEFLKKKPFFLFFKNSDYWRKMTHFRTFRPKSATLRLVVWGILQGWLHDHFERPRNEQNDWRNRGTWIH